MSTLNVTDVNAGKVNISSGGLKLSSHNGSGNYPSAETGLLIYDSYALSNSVSIFLEYTVSINP